MLRDWLLAGWWRTWFKGVVGLWVLVVLGTVGVRFTRRRRLLKDTESSETRFIMVIPPLLTALIEYVGASEWFAKRMKDGSYLSRSRLAERVTASSFSPSKMQRRIEGFIQSYTTGITEELLKSLLLLVLVVVEVLANMTLKCMVWTYAIVFMAFSHETRNIAEVVESRKELFARNYSPLNDCKVISKRKLIIVRHGESMWNSVFNRKHNISMLLRLVLVLFNELMLFCEYDSVLLDSPLSAVGILQAGQLRNWLAAATYSSSSPRLQEVAAVLKGSHPTADLFLVTSSLRRAISTLAIAFCDRLKSHPTDKVLTLSDLAEFTANPDAITLALRGGHAQPSLIEAELLTANVPAIYNQRLQCNLNEGVKRIGGTGPARLEKFTSQFLFSKDSDIAASANPWVVLVGHSSYIRHLCNYFLPPDCSTPLRHRKLTNCACVYLEISEVQSLNTDETEFWINPNSMEFIWGDVV